MLTLRLGISQRDAKAWSDLTSELSILAGLDDESDSVELERLTIVHKSWAQDFIRNKADFKDFPSGIVALLGAERYQACFRQYMNGPYLERITKDLGEALERSLENAGSIEGLVSVIKLI